MCKMLDRFSAGCFWRSFQLKKISADPGMLRVCCFHKLSKSHYTVYYSGVSPRSHAWAYGPFSAKGRSVNVVLSKEEPSVGRRRDVHLSSPSEQCTSSWFVYSNLYYNPEEDILQMMERRVPDVKWFVQDHKHNYLDLNPSLCCQCPSLSTTLGNRQMFASWWLGCFSVSNMQTTLAGMWMQWATLTDERRWCVGISREGLMRTATMPETKNSNNNTRTWTFMWILRML